MRRLVHPLNPLAVYAANKALERETGGRPLTMEPQDAALRKKWVDAYLSAGGQEQKNGGRRPIRSSKQPCPKTKWVDLQYCYVSGKGVAEADYAICTPDGEPVASGVLDRNGFAHVTGIPNDVTEILYSFNNDPPYSIFPAYKPFPNPFPVPAPDYIEQSAASGRLSSVLDWVWGALQGDFNEDPSLGQIAFGTVVTLIPFVDQAGDIRDIVANLKKLVLDGRWDEFFVWLSLILTIIGCVPEIGSAAKGVLKAVFKSGPDLSKVVRMLNWVGEGHAIRWLREVLGDLRLLANRAAEKIVEILAALSSQISRLKQFVREAAARTLDKILHSIEECMKRVSGMIERFVEFFQPKLKKMIDESSDVENLGKTETTNILKQESEPLARIGHGTEKAVEKELKQLALGLKSKTKNLDYKRWAEQNGWSTYGDLSGGGAFSKQIDEAMKSADKIHFNLDGVDVSKANGRLNDFGEPLSGNYTNYELFLLKTEPEFAKKVTWWVDGVAMPAGWSPF